MLKSVVATAIVAMGLSLPGRAIVSPARPSRANPAMVWPRGLDPAHADVFDHNELLIEASCDAVYRKLATPTGWPSWLIFARDVQSSEPGKPLSVNARFAWSIFGTPIEGVVFAAEPGRRFGYTNTPPGPPPSYAQTWLLMPRGAKCFVITEEVGKGEAARASKAAKDRRVHVAHDLWLASLRWTTVFGD